MSVDADEASEGLFYLAAGPVAAMALAIALVPLRELTNASNLTFVFLALTIAIAELGGRRAAVATALSSALSLDFFLTRPYLRLTIADKHDVIAFAGLAVCGLIAASLGAPRRRTVVALKTAARERDLQRLLLTAWQGDDVVEPALAKALRALRAALGVSAAVIRDDTGVVAGAAPADALRPPPDPEGGARIELAAGRRHVGWLDVWGSGLARADVRAALDDFARLVTLVLAARDAGRARRT